jgi:hypothetical protein
VNAKFLAKGIADQSPTAKNIYEACEQILTPLDHSQKFGSVSLAMAYDSNVQALPDMSEGVLNINKGTLKTLLQAGIGNMTSPTENYQWVPSYTLSYNKNFNSDTREGEFLTQSASIFLNHRPLDPSNYGFKAEISHVFQNQFDTGSTTSSTFRQFSINADLSTYYRTTLFKRIGTYLDAGLGPQIYMSDSQVANNEKRSGMSLHAKMGFNFGSFSNYWNPSLILMLSGIDATADNGSHTDFDSNAQGISLQNGLNFSDTLKGYLSFSASDTAYHYRLAGFRKDWNFVLGGQVAYRINPKWSWSTDASFGRNLSKIPDYQYFRWSLSSGVNYSLY